MYDVRSTLNARLCQIRLYCSGSALGLGCFAVMHDTGNGHTVLIDKPLQHSVERVVILPRLNGCHAPYCVERMPIGVVDLCAKPLVLHRGAGSAAHVLMLHRAFVHGLVEPMAYSFLGAAPF